MIFTLRKYEKLCKLISFLYKKDKIFCFDKTQNIPQNFIMLKHDVEAKPKKALKIAKIEYKYSLFSTFYVQAYLMTKKNFKYFSQISHLGSVISYHHDVMDSSRGNINEALCKFKFNIELFKCFGFEFTTVCQHGNPLINRVGYSSNRDFFRSALVQKEFPNYYDVMVNFPNLIGENYRYISDAGRKWNIVENPTMNDIVDSVNTPINLNEYLRNNYKDNNLIISTHPHRYSTTVFSGCVKLVIFKLVKIFAKFLLHFKFFKKFYYKHYEIAKKI